MKFSEDFRNGWLRKARWKVDGLIEVFVVDNGAQFSGFGGILLSCISGQVRRQVRPSLLDEMNLANNVCRTSGFANYSTG